MKKNKLIELLQAIPGNPDVVLWNGYVGDHQDINPDLVQAELVKYSKEFIRDYTNRERKEAGLLPLTDEELEIEVKSWKNEWDTPNPYFDEEQDKRIYSNRRKKIVYLQPMRRGKSTWDRLGTLDY